MLISKLELDSRKSRDLIPLQCIQCKQTHYRTKNIVLRILNGNLRKSQKGSFCSQKCKNDNRKKTVICHCHQCQKQIARNPSAIREKNFCSQSCSAKFYNAPRIVLKHCTNCGKTFRPSKTGQGKYCSHICFSIQRRREIFNEIENGNTTGRACSTLKKYLIHKRGRKCEICGLVDWGGKPLVIILDHINGNSDDNSLSNLRLVCSNCDANLPTYKSKNKGNGRTYRRKRAVGG